MKRIFDQLVEACNPIVKHYRDDLFKHDKLAIEADPGCPFLHWSHDCGTFILVMIDADDPRWPNKGEMVPYLFGTASREHVLRQFTNEAKWHAQPDRADHICHYFDGEKLRQITNLKAVEIAMGYERAIISLWREFDDVAA